mmetsp:Transcript_85479/g.184421  ORF Transcript_85479/g.184421 Transcript_85479/m.184421 type:complete len:128 (+) Transcript_85479:303-686(+)
MESVNFSTLNSQTNNRSVENKYDDSNINLDTLLNEFNTNDISVNKAPGKFSNNPTPDRNQGFDSLVKAKKCLRVLVGTAEVGMGHNESSLRPKRCDNILCMNCDRQVRSKDGCKFTTGLDYYFFRNN